VDRVNIVPSNTFTVPTPPDQSPGNNDPPSIPPLALNIFDGYYLNNIGEKSERMMAGNGLYGNTHREYTQDITYTDSEESPKEKAPSPKPEPVSPNPEPSISSLQQQITILQQHNHTLQQALHHLQSSPPPIHATISTILIILQMKTNRIIKKMLSKMRSKISKKMLSGTIALYPLLFLIVLWIQII